MTLDSQKPRETRRQFLAKSAYTSALTAGVASAAWSHLTPRSQADVLVPAETIALTDDIAPLVRLIESTPREQCFEKIAQKMADGATYRQVMAAAYLAAILNISPDPVGGALHSVLVVHSANHVSLDAAPDDRLIPMFWAVDYFKQNQHRNPWDPPEAPTRVASGDAAIAEFRQGMEQFDPELADRGITGMVRSCGAGRIAEELWKYGARDYRPIGHKAIYAANAWRTLQTIGWRHAEPTLRALARSLVGHGANSRQSGFTMDEQCYAANLELIEQHVTQLPKTWAGDRSEPTAVRELMDLIRNGQTATACELALTHLLNGTQQAQGVWDAVHMAAAEIVHRQTSIRPIHAVTSANGLRYAFNAAASDTTRLLVLLQGVGWMAQFVNFIPTGTRPFPLRNLEDLEKEDVPSDQAEAVDAIAANLAANPQTAARQTLSYLTRFGSADPLLNRARKLVIDKAEESHRYKFPAAAFEDFQYLSPKWRSLYLAAATYYLPGTSTAMSPAALRAKAALDSAL